MPEDMSEIWTFETLEAAETARCLAMTTPDFVTLRALFRADARWIHSSGKVDTVDSFVAKLESGDAVYLTIERSEVAYRVEGHFALASGVATIDALKDGAPHKLRNRFTNFWALEQGAPRLIWAQSTAMK